MLKLENVFFLVIGMVLRIIGYDTNYLEVIISRHVMFDESAIFNKKEQVTRERLEL